MIGAVAGPPGFESGDAIWQFAAMSTAMPLADAPAIGKRLGPPVGAAQATGWHSQSHDRDQALAA